MIVNSCYEDAVDVLNNRFWTVEGCGCGSEVWNAHVLDGFKWRRGVNKVVIILNNCVIKTSFSGWIEIYDENGKILDEPKFHEYENDACKIEWQIYNAAVKAGIDKFFAKVEQIFPYVYRQEKCIITCQNYARHMRFGEYNTLPYHIDGSSFYTLSFEQRVERCAKLRLEELGRRAKYGEALGFLIDNYSLDDLLCLQDFLIKYDINDLHGDNAGMFKDGTVKLFDFCGFESSTSLRVLENK